MKKILGIILIAGAFAACNNSGDENTNSDTTTVVQPDTMQVVTDTTVKTDTIGQGVNNNPTTDTTKH
jgi:ABC-type Fe3+-hydroxamate transport system substrate-binding protein